MNFKMTTNTSGFLAVAFSALAVMLAAAADAPPELTCNVTKTPDGFLHQLSRSSDCDTSWVVKNGGVLARNQDYDKNEVQSLTDQSLTSKLCHDNIDYTSTCGTDERAHCTYTCSSPISDPKASQPTPVNPIANHVNQNRSRLILLGVSGAVVMAVILYIICRKKKSPPSVVNYIEEQEVMVEIPDVN
ncbi:Transcriptional activator Myb [Dissostichus eleginoides]|uniref:Transcriptional activator Myb n=1 Tax=Dissostichus eleginoides TaxID=100907 RepID=A0AAD9C838_DISEL|nr:Transcriptional activator Myb [Dissostichus eleginoides]